MDARLPAHLEVSGLLRMAEADGGFAAVLAKGERDAGTILVLTMEKGRNRVLYERMPQLDGSRKFVPVKEHDMDNVEEFDEYLARRKRQDGDLWIVEVDIANPERFIAALNP
ncbi:DUF1491 family protein [Allopontixanthobacter sp.]|uniref:DUF1491 family protein n=1 Tax=Allopontixanthobacter sp. TaxID=2906452 RepID=UPI002AB8F6CF|nr:DUF1491 family protein [Allopontixanthobacter sp.]MDZ4308491.1 DUF1491 family protein [Allopontixanthobacter sp.]